jgi:endonuclease YncB( thermonuclease family)
VAQEVNIINEETIKIDSKKIRLFGVDTPVLKQKCIDSKNIEWGYAKCSKAFLESMLTNDKIECKIVNNNKYKQLIVVCLVNETEISKHGAQKRKKKYISDFNYQFK